MIELVRREELRVEPVRMLARDAEPVRGEPRAEQRRAQLRMLLLEELASDRLSRTVARELARFHGDAVIVHVHPVELPQLDRARLAADFELETLELRGDASLTPGGLRIESPRGEVDATLEQRVERMLTLLFGELP